MRRKIISFLLIVSMLLILTPDTVMAAKVEGTSLLPEKTGYAEKAAESDPAAMEGSGTEDSPYRIQNAEQLRLFADMVNGVGGTPNTGLCAVLTQNIDLSGVCGADIGSWTPIGTDKNPYTGIFNGGSFLVSGLYCQRAKSSYAGLFGCNNGTIRNLGVAGSVSAGRYTGGICGRNAGIITGCYSAAAVTGANDTGGICGYNDVTGTVNVCYHTGAVSGSKYVGGICGYNQNDTSSCYNMGTVNGSGTSVGGICGYNKKLVSGCYNTGEVSGKGKKYVGSVCGYNHSKSVFLNCYYLITGTEKGNYGVAMTLEQFASGEVCWLLNDGKSENVIWYQTCGAGFPGFGGKVVYQVQRQKAGGKAGEMIFVYTNVKENKQTAADSAYVEESDSGEHEHVYQEPEWEWKEYKAAMAVFTCQDCGEKLTLEAKITEEVKAATCGAAGENIYTASVERGGETYQDRKTKKGEKLPHEQLLHTQMMPATCTTSGNIEYWQCPACKKYFKEQEGKTEIQKKDVVIKATGHDYGEPVWNWDVENAPLVVSATFTCTKCSDAQEVIGEVTVETKAGCMTTGNVTYKAVVTFNKPYERRETVSGKLIPHTYDEPKWTWASDFSTATATFVCTECGDDSKIERVTPKLVETTASTCQKAGAEKYEASVTIDGKTYTDEKSKPLPLGDCRYVGEPEWTWASDYSTATAKFTCINCGTITPKETRDVTKSEPSEVSCGTPGEVTYTAKVKFDGKEYTGKKTEKIVKEHTLTHVAAKEAECEIDGNDEYWECSVCHTLFSDEAGLEVLSQKPIVPKIGHQYESEAEDKSGDIFICVHCGQRVQVTQLSNGTTVVQSLEEGIDLPLQPVPEEEQEESAPQNAEKPDDRNEDGQNVEEAQEELGKSDEQGEEAGQEQGRQDVQNPSEEQLEGDDGLTDAERYGLLYPESEEPENDLTTEGSWEERAVSLRAAAPKDGTEQTAGEQQGFSLQISIAVLAVLAGAVLFLGLRKRNTI